MPVDQACEVLADTGIRVAKRFPKRTESGTRPLLRPCEASVGTPDSLGKMDEHQGSAPCIPVWKTGVYLSTPMLGIFRSSRGNEALIEAKGRSEPSHVGCYE